NDRIGIARTHFEPLRYGPADRQVAIHEVVSRRLIRNGIGLHAAPHELRNDLRSVTEQSHGKRATLRAILPNELERLVERGGLDVEIACIEPLLNPALLTLDAK